MEHEINALTQEIIAAAIAVHRALGPGLLESAYEACLSYEFAKRKMNVERQKPLPVLYEGVRIDCAYRLDFLVEDCVVVEVKSVERVTNVHQAQLLSYLKLLDKRVGLLINFNVKCLLEGGIARRVHNLAE